MQAVIRSAATWDASMHGAVEVLGMAAEGDIVLRLEHARQSMVYTTIGATIGLEEAVSVATAAGQRVRNATGGDTVTVCAVQEGASYFDAAGDVAAISGFGGFGAMFAPLTVWLSSPQASSGAWTQAAAEEAAAAAMPGQQVRVGMGPRLRADGTMLGERRTGGGGFVWSSRLAAADRQAEQAAEQAGAAAALPPAPGADQGGDGESGPAAGCAATVPATCVCGAGWLAGCGAG